MRAASWRRRSSPLRGRGSIRSQRSTVLSPSGTVRYRMVSGPKATSAARSVSSRVMLRSGSKEVRVKISAKG